MTIEEAIILMEEAYIEEDIKGLSPKDRLNFWASLKEFERPKIQRSVFEPINENDFQIEITYGSNKTKAHESISKPLDQSEKD